MCDHSNESYLVGLSCSTVLCSAFSKKLGNFVFILNLASAGSDRGINLYRVTVRFSKRHGIP